MNLSPLLPELRYRPLWTSLGWLIAAAIVWLSLVQAPPTIDIDQGDKLGHFIGYGTLMFWFCELYATRRLRLSYGAAWIAMGIAIEFIQGQLGYRSYDVLDMVANTVGVLIGWSVAALTRAKLFGWLEQAVRL